MQEMEEIEKINEDCKTWIKNAKTLNLGIIDQFGYPAIYPMEKVSCEEMNSVLFITKKDSNKVRCLKENTKASIGFHREDKVICIKGTIEMITDKEKMYEMIGIPYQKRLDQSGIEKYCLLQFFSQEGSCSFSGKTVPLSITNV